MLFDVHLKADGRRDVHTTCNRNKLDQYLKEGYKVERIEKSNLKGTKDAGIDSSCG